MKLFNEKTNRHEGCKSRHFRNQSAATQSHNSWREQNTSKYNDGYNNPYEDFDHAKDRKQQRRAARAAQKQARIQAHQQWVERCRANRTKLAEEKAKRTKVTSSHSQPFTLSSQSSSSQSSFIPNENTRHDVENRNKNVHVSNKIKKVNNDSSKCTTSRESKGISKKGKQTIKHDVKETKNSESAREMEENSNNCKSSSKTAKRERTITALSEQAYKVARRETNHEISTSNNDKASKEKNGNKNLQKHKLESSVIIPVVVSEHVRRCVNKLTLSNLTHIIYIICALFGDTSNSATSVDAADEIDIVEEKNGDDKKRKMKSAQIHSHINNRNDIKNAIVRVGENDSDGSQRQLREIRNLPHAPRAIVMASLAEQVIKFCAIDTGVLTPINTLPMAGVVRGLQVMYGNIVGGELIEKLARALHVYIFESNESAASNIGMIFAQLYLIYSVDATFIISLLQFLTLTTDNISGDDHSDSAYELSNKNEIHTNALSCAVAILRICGDKLVKEAGNGLESLLQQVRERHTQWCQTTHSASTTEITSSDVTVRDNGTNANFTKELSVLYEEQQEEQLTKSTNYTNTSTDEDANTIMCTSHPKSLLPQKHNLISVQHFQNRCAAQISIMADIASGMTRLHRKRNNTESDWSLDELLQQLCTLLPGAQEIMKKSASKRHDSFGTNALRKADHLRSLRRIVQTMNTLLNIPFTAILRECKPARWYEPGVLLEFLEQEREQELHKTLYEKEAQCKGGIKCEAKKSIDRNDYKECDLDRHDTFIGHGSKLNINQNINNKSENGVCISSSPADVPISQKSILSTLTRREEIHQMRTAERAIAGQRFNTEFKREVFQCVINASDDLDCFNALTARDPSHTRFADICAVLIQCCYQEEVYNTFYANVLSRFLSIKPAFRKTFQFSLWDKFKSIRLDGVDVAGYLNLSCLITAFMERGTFTLSVLRGLDLNEVNKTIGLFTRIILLRMIMSLSSSRLTSIFFGGDGLHAHDVQINTADFRRCLTTFINHYFIDESVASRWLPLFYDIVATDTIFAKKSNNHNMACADDNISNRRINNGVNVDGDNDKLALFMKRVQVAYKALKNGIM